MLSLWLELGEGTVFCRNLASPVPSLPFWHTHSCGFLSVGHRSAVSASPGTLLDKQILGTPLPPPGSIKSEIPGVGPAIDVLIDPPDNSDACKVWEPWLYRKLGKSHTKGERTPQTTVGRADPLHPPSHFKLIRRQPWDAAILNLLPVDDPSSFTCY